MILNILLIVNLNSS